MLRVRKGLQKTDAGLVVGDLKTESSRRTMEMPKAVAVALAAWKKEQAGQQLQAGPAWHDNGLVLADEIGRPVNRQRVHRGFRAATAAAGIGKWQPRECRHTHVSVMSDAGVDIEVISDAVGHANSAVTRVVYRHQIADKISGAAIIMDAVYGKKAAS